MNNENEKIDNNIAPYRATQNLNTAIANPTVNINDTMGVNIQNVSTNRPKESPPAEETHLPNNNINVNTIPNMNANQNVLVQNSSNNINNNVQRENTQNVTRTYVTADNKPKKKKLTLNLGSEFKIALLIIVILLVFIFLLPLITNLING